MGYRGSLAGDASQREGQSAWELEGIDKECAQGNLGVQGPLQVEATTLLITMRWGIA